MLPAAPKLQECQWHCNEPISTRNCVCLPVLLLRLSWILLDQFNYPEARLDA